MIRWEEPTCSKAGFGLFIYLVNRYPHNTFNKKIVFFLNICKQTPEKAVPDYAASTGWFSLCEQKVKQTTICIIQHNWIPE